MRREEGGRERREGEERGRRREEGGKGGNGGREGGRKRRKGGREGGEKEKDISIYIRMFGADTREQVHRSDHHSPICPGFSKQPWLTLVWKH